MSQLNKIVNYIPLEALLAGVYRMIDPKQLNQLYIMEWAYDAMEAMEVRYTFQEAIEYRQVVNHKTMLPAGLKFIEQILYKDITTTTNITLFDMNQDAVSPATITATNPTDLYALQYADLGWHPLRASNSIFTRSVHCQQSPNLYCACEQEYSIDPDGCITTTMNSAYLMIAYLSHPKNEDGQFLVPDDRNYREAVTNYILMKYWEMMWNRQVDGAANRHERYRQLWELTRAKCVGNLLMPSIDGYQNLQEQITRIGPHYDQYYNGFGRLGRKENLNFHR